MIKLIKKFFQKRKLKKQIRQSSFNCQSMEMASDKEFEEMKFIGDYQILREIGKGAFGRVLLAEKDGHQVAIKETLARSRTALKG